MIASLVMSNSVWSQKVDLSLIEESPREVFRMNEGWKFHRGHLPQPNPEGHHWVYKSVKAGAARGPAAFQYDDGGWKTVDLPHDYVVEGNFTKDPTLVSHGFLPRPEGWYRRQFKLPNEARGKSIWLYFDGVFGKSQVWVNGLELKRNDNGYIGYRVDISDVAHYGDRPNVVSVKCDPSEAQGWWYEGGGIYRHVWLTLAEPIHVAPYGVYIDASTIKNGKWDVKLETAVENEVDEEREITVVNTIITTQGKPIATVKKNVTLEPGETTKIDQNMQIDLDKVKPWDLENPNLYVIKTELFADGKKLDAHTDKFGFRTLKFDPDKGFFLNDKPVKFKGVCMHQDHAGVGVALPDSIQAFRIARLKHFGVNAYRCSHNPPTPELIEECDKQGVLLLNENRFFNASDDCLRQLDEQVRRDRNHPSVMMWSTFNEEDWQGDERGVNLVKRMKRLIHKTDHFAKRPVTGAMSAGFSKEGSFGPLDVLGINYALGVHDHVHKNLYPNKMIYSSEAVSHSATRGEWKDRQYVYNNYDNHWVGWGDSVRNSWKHIDTRPWDAGIFLWTGFDYRGEPTPVNAWPIVNSYFGIVDTCGFAKDSFYLLQALWTDKPMAHVFPHWNLGNEMVGKKVKVGTYTNGDEVELILNGKSLGKKKVDPYMQLFWDDVEYQPGELKMIAYKDGKKYAEDKVQTTGNPVALKAEVKLDQWQRKSVYADSYDAVPVVVYAIDDKGRRVPIADNQVEFEVQGGRVLGVGNGNPESHEPDVATSRKLFNGYACAIVLPDNDASTLQVLAKSQGLKSGGVKLPIKKNKMAFKQYPTMDGAMVLTDWRLSEITDKPQDPNRPIADGDMNTWQTVAVGQGAQPQWAQKQGWATYRAIFDMPGKGEAWDLSLNNVVGQAVVYVNGKEVAKKAEEKAGNISAEVKAPAGSKVTISVQLHSNQAKSGLIGAIKLMPKK